MKTITQEHIQTVLRQLGLQRGDTVLCHSALHFLGRPEGGLAMYYAALAEILGLPRSVEDVALGTLAVPAFNFAFARGEPFDPVGTPSRGMGAFSEYVRQLPWACRTRHPMQSLAVTGRHAGDLCERDTPSAFDPGSAFERLLELDAKLLLLGADVQAASIVHYSEQRAAVPYRYWKKFRGPVRVENTWEERTYAMFVRSLELDPQLQLTPVEDVLRSEGRWHSVSVNYGQASVCRLRDFVSAADRLLAADPWCLVSNRPSVEEVGSS